MKKQFIYILHLLLTGILVSESIYAQPKTSDKFSFKGELKDANIESVKLDYYPTFSIWMLMPAKTLISKIKNKSFDFNLSDVTEPGYVFITFKYANGDYEALHYKINLNPLLIEPGDDVLMKITASKVEFEGKGAAKYNCWLQMTKAYEELSQTTRPVIADYFKNLDYSKKQSREILNKSYQILLAHKSQMSFISYKILSLESESRASAAIVLEMGANGASQPIAARKKYLKDNADFISPKNTFPRVDKSSLYADFLLRKERLIISLVDTTANTISSNINLFHRIAQKYRGPVLDKLLAMLLTSFSFGDSTQFIREQTLKIVKIKAYRDLILNHSKIFGTGTKFYDFHLQDQKGNMVSLSDFRNKVIIVDLYFTGCSGCAQLARAIKPVIRQFKNNPNVSFVSICVDKTKGMFLKAVESEIYSEKTSVNLYTNGDGLDHDLIKYYGFQGFPQFFLIDKQGKILYENPPRPGLNHQNNEPDPNNPGVLKLIDVINRGLSDHRI